MTATIVAKQAGDTTSQATRGEDRNMLTSEAPDVVCLPSRTVQQQDALAANAEGQDDYLNVLDPHLHCSGGAVQCRKGSPLAGASQLAPSPAGAAAVGDRNECHLKGRCIPVVPPGFECRRSDLYRTDSMATGTQRFERRAIS